MRIQKDKKALDKLYRRRDRYELQPDFQREEVWNTEKEQILLDTILEQWDIPKIYIRVIGEDSFEIADGQQRLATIFKFYDNKVVLSKKLSPEYGGFYYNNLPDKIKDIFDDYELDITLIYDATEKEIRELFNRLQLGVPLNLPERLNAMLGGARDFVKELSQIEFFKNSSLVSRRYAYHSVCAQILKLEVDGVGDLKFKDLENFYKTHTDFNKKSSKGRKILKTMKIIGSIFKGSEKIFKNRASIVSLYLLVSQLLDKSVDFKKDSGKLREFYKDFLERLGAEVQKGSEATDTELILYQSKINQAADSKEAIETRNNILQRRLAIYDKSFQKVFFEGKIATLSIDSARKQEIGSVAAALIDLVTDINKLNSSNNTPDMFKITNEMLKKLASLGEPATTLPKYKSFIDAVYKIFYEGSGTLVRIPKKFINNKSIFLDIKTLRTDIYHDIEHGKKKHIKAKQQLISETYQKYSKKSSIVSLSGGNLFLLQKKILTELGKSLMLIKKDIE